MMNDSKAVLMDKVRQYGMVIALFSIVVFFQIITGGILLKPLNVTNIFLQNSYILVLAIGMLLCILTGNIDLSVGSVAAFISAISGVLIVRMGVSVPVAIVVSLAAGALIGAWNGFWIAYLRIPAFIVTLAGLLIFRGLTMVILRGQTIAPFPASYQIMGAGFIPDLIADQGFHTATLLIGIVCAVVYDILQILDRRKKKAYGIETESGAVFVCTLVVITALVIWISHRLAIYKGVPNVLILLTALILIFSFITSKTTIGRHIYAYGGNEKAARLSGIKTQRVLFGVYVNMGILSALAGFIYASRLNAATPKAGVNFELDAIAACYIGGASASGGIGTVWGAIIGGLVMGVLNNGMSIMGISVDWQQAIKGLVLLLAVAFDVLSKSKDR